MPALGKGIKPHPLISNLPAKGDRAARAMWQDATESETTNRLIWITNFPDTRYLFPRPYLRAWAENHSDYRPRFLFPEVGKPSKPRITECDEEHKRWRACGEDIQQERSSLIEESTVMFPNKNGNPQAALQEAGRQAANFQHAERNQLYNEVVNQVQHLWEGGDLRKHSDMANDFKAKEKYSLLSLDTLRKKLADLARMMGHPELVRGTKKKG